MVIWFDFVVWSLQNYEVKDVQTACHPCLIFLVQAKREIRSFVEHSASMDSVLVASCYLYQGLTTRIHPLLAVSLQVQLSKKVKQILKCNSFDAYKLWWRNIYIYIYILGNELKGVLNMHIYFCNYRTNFSTLSTFEKNNLFHDWNGCKCLVGCTQQFYGNFFVTFVLILLWQWKITIILYTCVDMYMVDVEMRTELCNSYLLWSLQNLLEEKLEAKFIQQTSQATPIPVRHMLFQKCVC